MKSHGIISITLGKSLFHLRSILFVRLIFVLALLLFSASLPHPLSFPLPLHVSVFTLVFLLFSDFSHIEYVRKGTTEYFPLFLYPLFVVYYINPYFGIGIGFNYLWKLVLREITASPHPCF